MLDLRVVSFSLWGDNPKYTIGAVRNAELVKAFYPGWEARFYVCQSVPGHIIAELECRGARVINMQEPGHLRGMFWRFKAASDPRVRIMISRDTDSRIGRREVEAVGEWLGSFYKFHIMRDHPHHGTHILGGMWGVKAPLLRNMDDLTFRYFEGERGDRVYQASNGGRGHNQKLLQMIYPHVAKDAMVHDEFFDDKPWPSARVGLEFVGQVWDENELTIAQHLEILKTHQGERLPLPALPSGGRLPQFSPHVPGPPHKIFL